MADSLIAVYGATGFTGRLVAGQLARRGRAFIASARSSAKLADLVEELAAEHDACVEARVASVDQPDSLDAMLEGVDVLINCAGPFVDVGPPVVEAAVRNGVHYLDTTGEQPHMKWVESVLDKPAADAGVALVPGCAYEYAAGDFAARVATKMGARHLGICYAVRDMKMSHGTKKSVARAILGEGVTFVGGKLQRRRPAYRLFEVPLPGGRTVTGAWFPGGEPLTVPRYADVEQVEDCLAVGGAAGRALRLAMPVVDGLLAVARGVLPVAVSAAESAIDQVIEWTDGNPHAGQGRPEFLAVAFDARDSQFYAAVSGTDVYGVTARIIVEAASRLLAEPPSVVGFTSPAALFEARNFVEACGMSLIER